MPQIDEQKLYNAVARDEIYQLVCTYMRGQDRLDAETQRSVFWDDAWLSYGIYEGGPDGFVDFAQGALKNFKTCHHFIGQVQIDVEGDEAFGEVYYQAQHRGVEEDASETDNFISGRYIDRYERRDGVWKMAFRSELVDWVRLLPAADAWFKDSKMILGARMPDDLLYHREKFYAPSGG